MGLKGQKKNTVGTWCGKPVGKTLVGDRCTLSGLEKVLGSEIT